MNKQLTRIFVLCAVISGAAVTFAQAPPAGAAPDPQARMAQLAKDLALTDAQQPQFQRILEEERTNLGASMKQEREQKTDLQTAHQNHQKIEDAAMAKLKPLLSDAQYQKYQAIVEAEAYARHHRAPTGSAAPPAAQ